MEAANQAWNITFDAEGTPGLFIGYSYGNARNGSIGWDADVVVLGGSGGAPQLVIGADGTVLAANDVLVNGVAPEGRRHS